MLKSCSVLLFSMYMWCIYVAAVSFIRAALLIQFLQGDTMGDVSLIRPVCVCVSRRSNGEATSPFPSAKRTAAQAPEQPGRQSLLQPSQREFKAFHGSLCLTLFPDDNTIKATCARPPSPHPHAALPFCCLHHVLWRFICCFHVRMSPFTVNNWCGLSKPSKMPASSASAPRALIKKNYAVTSDIISICTHSTQNHFELKINDSLAHVPCFALVFSEAFLTPCACVCLSACVCVCWFCVLSAEKSGLSGEQEETQKTGVNNSFPSSYLNTPPAQEGSWEDHSSVCFSCKFAAENTSYLRSLFFFVLFLGGEKTWYKNACINCEICDLTVCEVKPGSSNASSRLYISALY